MQEEVSTELVAYVPPAARPLSEFSVTTTQTDEYVMCDVDALEYHKLNELAYEIWRSCDGERTVDEIARIQTQSGVLCVPETVQVCLIDLEYSGLMLTSCSSPIRTLNRRHLVIKLAAAGFGAALLPSVRSITTLAVMCTTPICGGTYPETSSCNSSEQCASCCCCSNGPTAICKDCGECKNFGGFDCLPT